MSARRSLEKQTLLEKAYNAPPGKIEEIESPKTAKKVVPKIKKIAPEQVRRSEDDLAYVRMQSDENSPQLAHHYSNEIVEKDKHGSTPGDSHMAGQQTQGDITESGVETVGG